MVRARTVVVLTGLPGTGKSTLADLLAGDVGSPAFAGDWLLGALAPHGILDGVARSTLLAAYYDLLASLITRQLLLGQSAIVDCVLDDAAVTAWRRNVDEHGGRLVVVECVCSDEARAPAEGREPPPRDPGMARGRLGSRGTDAARIPAGDRQAADARRRQPRRRQPPPARGSDRRLRPPAERARGSARSPSAPPLHRARLLGAGSIPPTFGEERPAVRSAY